MKWYIGCSGFSYSGWKNEFYPEGLVQRKWFEYYSEQFNSLELNVTFYRYPQLKTLQGWHERSPKDFRMSVKAPRLVTHFKQFNNLEDSLTKFYDVVGEGLQDKLGCVLFQLPGSFEYTEERLEKIIEALDLKFTNAIEFRNPSWWNEKVFKGLDKVKTIFCSVSYSKKISEEVVGNTNKEYYRFHGVPRLWYSEYKSDFLEKVVKDIKANKPKEAYLYFNNTASMAALTNAREAQRLTSK